MNERKGQCMCGAVRFTIRDGPTGFGACHCEMCRRWAGAAFLAISVARDAVTLEGEADISRIQSSDWAERAWCGKCGSNLWCRLTGEGASATMGISLGLLDDADGLSFDSEIFIDCKPDSFAFEGTETRETMTRAEVFAKYAPGAEQPS